MKAMSGTAAKVCWFTICLLNRVPIKDAGFSRTHGGTMHMAELSEKKACLQECGV